MGRPRSGTLRHGPADLPRTSTPRCGSSPIAGSTASSAASKTASGSPAPSSLIERVLPGHSDCQAIVRTRADVVTELQRVKADSWPSDVRNGVSVKFQPPP